jgi:cell division protein FtsB
MSLGTLARSRSPAAAGLLSAAQGGRGDSRAASGARATLGRLALAAYAGISLYCLLSALVGPAGLTAYRRLEERKAAMEANLARLGAIREGLSAELESLKADPDRAAREARSLGYLRKGETAILLEGRSAPAAPMDAGHVLPFAEPAALGDRVLKEISLGAGLAVMALLLAPMRPGKGASRRRAYR